ncbi:MAG TPA: ABC transporter ATP-binding protein [Candidatus Obscuribacterales bacterium]
MSTVNELNTGNGIAGTLGWLWPFWKPLRLRLIFLLIATPLTVLLDVWMPMFVKQIFDQLQSSAITRELLAQLALTIFALGFFHFIFYIVVQSTRGLTNYHFENVFRLRLSGVMLQLGLGFFQKFRTGDVTTRLIDDISEKKLGWFACSGIFRLYEALLMLTGCLYFMFRLHWGLSLLTALPLGAVAAFYIHSSRRTMRYSQQSQAAISELNAYLTSTLDGIRVVKAYGQEQRAAAAFDTVVENQYSKDMALVKVSSLLEISYSRFSELGALTIYLVGGWLVIEKQLSLGSLIAFNAYIFMLIWPMVDIGQFFIKGRQAGVSVDRVRELEDYPAEISQPAQPVAWPTGDLSLRFAGVGFAYGEQQVLEDVSFSAVSGQTLALAGAIGAGKSLLLDLVPRMLEADQGTIYLNDQPLAAYALDELRRHIGFVSQTPSLFSATIRENILFGREGISEADLQASIAVAQLEQDLPLFSEGLETRVGQRGVKISGGQKQRIAIARALVEKPRILILDDCTSALDAETETRFWKALHAFVPGMLVLLVTHRVRTLQLADSIVLLQQGRVIATGHHDELSQHPLYRQLYLQTQ